MKIHWNIKIHEQGFNLFEILIAIAIIGILVSIAMSSYLAYLAKHKIKITREEIRCIASHARDYRIHQGSYYSGGLPPGSTMAIESMYGMKIHLSTDTFDYSMTKCGSDICIRAVANASEDIFNVSPGDTIIYNIDKDSWTGTIN